MKRLLTFTLFALLAISCSRGVSHSSKGSTMTYTASTQADLDTANQRVKEFKQELLQQGFHEISSTVTSSSGDSSNLKEEVVLAGQHGKLKDLRVTLWTTKYLQKDQPHVSGGIEASIVDDEADRDFEGLYKKVCFVVTGNTYFK